MKKTFALVLAVAMVMSLAAVSFAAAQNLDLVSDDALRYYGDEVYDSAKPAGGKYMQSVKTDSEKLAYGDTVYFLLTDGSGNALTEYEAVEKLKIKAKWEMGGDLVESVAVVKKNIGNTYQYYVAVKVASKQTTADADIVGTLTLNRRGNSADYATIKDLERDISFNVFYRGNTWQASKELEIDGDVSLKYDTNYALKFSADDEVELSFGDKNSALNEGTFTIDVSGQGKLFFRFDTKANDGIVAANAGAKLKFVNFGGVSFNRTGEFAYEMEDGAYAYQIVDGKLTAIPGCEYDEADETFYFYTRTLGSYVFSDVELVNATVDAPVVTAPEEVTNPGTGAAA